MMRSLLALAALPAALCAAEELLPELAADDECAAGGSGEEGACGLVAMQLRGLTVHAASTASGGYYIERELVANEGHDIKVQAGLYEDGCKALCDRTPSCNSFTLGVGGQDSGKCYLKDKKVTAQDATSYQDWNKQNYKTFYKAPEVPGYTGRSLVTQEGQEVGKKANTDARGCADSCNQNSRCHSFTLGLSGDDAGSCYLKDGHIQANAAASNDAWNSKHYMTYYKTGGGAGPRPAPHTPASAQPAPAPRPASKPTLPKPHPPSKEFKSANECSWKAIIDNPSDCSKAARELGYGSSRSQMVDPKMASLPPGCFYAQGIKDLDDGLWLNHFGVMTFVKMGDQDSYDHQEDGIDMLCKKVLYEQQKEAGVKCKSGHIPNSLSECRKASQAVGKGAAIKEVPQSQKGMTFPLGCYESMDPKEPGIWYNGNTFSFDQDGKKVKQICTTYAGRSR